MGFPNHLYTIHPKIIVLKKQQSGTPDSPSRSFFPTITRLSSPSITGHEERVHPQGARSFLVGGSTAHLKNISQIDQIGSFPQFLGCKIRNH